MMSFHSLFYMIKNMKQHVLTFLFDKHHHQRYTLSKLCLKLLVKILYKFYILTFSIFCMKSFFPICHPESDTARDEIYLNSKHEHE